MLYSFALVFISIFVALDIIGTLPIFIGMTRSLSIEARNAILDTSMVVALITALVFAAVGEKIFHFLGITLSDFKIAGGLILLLLSLTDLVKGPEMIHQASGSTGVVPLAVPLITGPSVITTLVFQVRTHGYLISILALIANYLLAWQMLRHSPKVTRLIGNDGTVILSKIVALLLVAISVSMIRSGIFESIAFFQSS